jgi:MFS family permease
VVSLRTSARRELVLLECGNVLGGISNALVMVVIPWLVLERTGSPAAAGIAGALTALPGIVVAPVVGAVVDRVGRKVVSALSDVCSAVSVLLFPVLDALGLLDLGAILALTFVGAALDPAGYTARKALIPDVARSSGVTRNHVNGLHEGLFMAGWVIGPMLGAVSIATIGAVATMWLALAAFGLAALAVAAMKVPNLPTVPEGPSSGDGRASWRVGLRVLVADRPVLVLTGAVTVLAMIYVPTESVLLPVHFEAENRPAAFGVVLSALSVGGMLGAFGFGWIARRAGLHRIATVCMLLTACAYVPIAFLPPAAVMWLPALLLGLAWGPLEPLLNTVVQDRFPEDQHGRVYGVQLAAFYAAAPLGQLVAGVAVQGYGVQPVFFAVAAGLLVVAAATSAAPAMRRLDEERRPAGAG